MPTIYIVHSWSELMSYENASYEGTDYIIKFANFNLDGVGNFIGEGGGTELNPYKCYTYDEMLAALGASTIDEIKLADEEEHLYIYNNTYAKHISKQSTIDFKNEQSLQTITFYNNVDFNGWTIANLTFETNAQWEINNNCKVSNGIFVNLILSQDSSGDGFIKGVSFQGTSYIYTYFYNCYLDIHFSNNETDFCLFKHGWHTVTRSIIDITGDAGQYSFKFTKIESENARYNLLVSSIINFNVTEAYINDPYTRYEACRVNGKIKLTQNANCIFAYHFWSSFLNVLIDGSPQSFTTPGQSACNIGNIGRNKGLLTDSLTSLSKTDLTNYELLNKKYYFPIWIPQTWNNLHTGWDAFYEAYSHEHSIFKQESWRSHSTTSWMPDQKSFELEPGIYTWSFYSKAPINECQLTFRIGLVSSSSGSPSYSSDYLRYIKAYGETIIAESPTSNWPAARAQINKANTWYQYAIEFEVLKKCLVVMIAQDSNDANRYYSYACPQLETGSVYHVWKPANSQLYFTQDDEQMPIPLMFIPTPAAPGSAEPAERHIYYTGLNPPTTLIEISKSYYQETASSAPVEKEYSYSE